MKSGALIHKITFQAKQAGTRDPVTGAVEYGWADVDKLSNVPAQVLTGPGKEPRVDSADQPETTARINCRWFPADVHEMMSWRILWDGRVFNIKSVTTDATARREYRMECTDGVGDGS